jgi:hypothetical protein
MKQKLYQFLVLLMVVTMSSFTFTPPTHHLPQNDRYVPVLAYELPPVEALTLSASTLTAATGSQVCIAVTAKDFQQILSMQYSMNWDPKVLKFREVKSFGLPGLRGTNFSAHLAEKGILTYSWYDGNLQGVTKPDGARLYEICFDVIGEAGNKTMFQFTSQPTIIEITNAAGLFLTLKGEEGGVEVK